MEERSALTRWTTLRDVTKSEPEISVGPLDRIEAVARYRKSTIAAGAVLGLFFAGVAARVIPPTYEASAALVVGKGWFDKDPNAASRSEMAMNTEVQIAKSDRVLRAAIETFGVDELYPSIRRPGFANATREDAAVARAAQSYSVRAEKGTNVFKLVFSHKNRDAAAAFINVVAEKVVALESSLRRHNGATELLLQIKQKHVDSFRNISDELSKFSISGNVYSVHEQRNVLLARESSVKSSVAAIESAMAEKEAVASSLAKQLTQLKIANNRSVSNAVTSLGKSARQNAPTGEATGFSAIESDPPLLLIRVYQEAIKDLVRVNSEAAGLAASLLKQKAALLDTQKELVKLSENEAYFQELSREAASARANVEAISRQVAEQQLQDEVNAASMSSVALLQRADAPLVASFPRLSILLPLGVVAGMLLALLFAMVTEARRRKA